MSILRFALFFAVVTASVTHVEAATVYAVTTANNLLSFDSATPGVVTVPVPITGLQAGEFILGIDFRPATGGLYGLGSSSRLYIVSLATGLATQVGSAGAFSLNGTAFGFDFNPTVDRIRVTSTSGQDLRLNPNDGTLAGTDGSLAYAAGDPNFGATARIVGSAYTNNFAGAATTTLYDIDSNLDILATQNPPNNGTLNTVGPLGFNTSDLVGFDIAAGSGIAFASLTPAGGLPSSLYTINLTTGASTLVGTIGGPGPTPIADISVFLVPVPEPSTLGLLVGGIAALCIRKFKVRR